MYLFTTDDINVVKLNPDIEFDFVLISGVLERFDDVQLLFQYKLFPPCEFFELYHSGRKVTTNSASLVTESDLYPNLSGVNFILETHYIKENIVVFESSVETLFLTPSSLAAHRSYCESTQSQLDNLYSIYSNARFLHSLKNNASKIINYSGKSVFLSGYGAGKEVSALLQLGVKVVFCFDPNPHSCEIVLETYSNNPRVVCVTSEYSLPNKFFDYVISRHVIEHIHHDLQALYLKNLLGLLNVNGRLIIEFPNRDFPIDPHTNIYFFHLLNDVEKMKYSTFFTNVSTPTDEFANKLSSIRDLYMLNKNSFVEILPTGCEIESFYPIYRNPRFMECGIPQDLEFSIFCTLN